MKKRTIKTNVTILLLFTASICLTSGFGANAQSLNKREQLESQKVAFFTQQLNLTVDEAQVFWPLYNEYQQKDGELNKSRRNILKRLENEPNLDEKELTELADKYIAIQLDEAKLASTYHEKFKKILPIKKLIAYYDAERKYKRFLLQQLQKRKRVDTD